MAEEITKKFKCRNEELSVIANFLKGNFVNDQSDFLNHSPDYDAVFLTGFETKITQVEGIVFPQNLIKALKVITDRVYNNMNSTRDYANKIEDYVNRATDPLTVNKEDFGIKEVRNEINQGDAEGYNTKMVILLQNVDANLAALTNRGYTATQRTEIGTLHADVKADNILQNAKMEEKEDLVKVNMNVLNDLWAIMSGIMDTGKILYRLSNAEKLENYEMTKYISRVRNEGPNNPPAPPPGP